MQRSDEVKTLTFGKKVPWKRWEYTAVGLLVSTSAPYPTNRLQSGVT